MDSPYRKLLKRLYEEMVALNDRKKGFGILSIVQKFYFTLRLRNNEWKEKISFEELLLVQGLFFYVVKSKISTVYFLLVLILFDTKIE